MANKTVTLIFDRTPLSLNRLFNLNYSQREREKEKWRDLVWLRWMEMKRLMFLKPVVIEYTLSFDTTRERDLDNYIGGVKYINDALKKTFLTRDDHKWLTGITVNFKKGKESTTILIVEVEEINE